MKKISLVVPCYNEEASLPLLYDELCKVMTPDYEWQILFINDGSRDATLSVIKDLYERDSRVSYVDLSRNYGKEKAMLAAFDYAEGDCMIMLDADLQHPPSVIPRMLEKWETGFEDVYGSRITRGKESWLRRNLSMAFYKSLSRLSNVEMLENVGDFRLLDRKCIDVLKNMRESERYTKGLVCDIGFRKVGVEFESSDRKAGESKWGLWKLFRLAIDGIVSFSAAPLRLATILGSISSVVAFFFGIYYMIKTLVYGDPVAGFPTLIVVILFMGGVQLLCIGILGEYVGRTFIESKRRPVYNVSEYRHH